jgi:SAM-dependent methyltransferase
LNFGYFQPSNYYDAVVNKLLKGGDTWLDAGGGHQIFPGNASLAHELARRASWVVAVDPSDNVERNPFVHERMKCLIEEYKPSRAFDLITFRMVVEHIVQPLEVINTIARLLNPGGRVVVFTVSLMSPINIISRMTPDTLHYPIKRLFWSGEEDDTFPTVYKMNTRKTLKQLFSHGGLEERFFAYLDDCSTFGRFRILNYIELSAWWLLSRTGFRYPENNLLGVYAKGEKSVATD